MKRVLCSVMLIAVLMTAILIPVSAATNYYTDDVTRNLVSMYTSYYEYLPDEANGPIFLAYVREVLNSGAYTRITAPEGSTGWTFTCMFYHYYEARRGHSDTVSNGMIISSTAMETYPYATRVTHSGHRTIGEDHTVWEYYYTDPNHIPYGQ